MRYSLSASDEAQKITICLKYSLFACYSKLLRKTTDIQSDKDNYLRTGPI